MTPNTVYYYWAFALCTAEVCLAAVTLLLFTCWFGAILLACEIHMPSAFPIDLQLFVFEANNWMSVCNMVFGFLWILSRMFWFKI
jgi:formate-dependent nitrite reductase membrane component NrfD